MPKNMYINACAGVRHIKKDRFFAFFSFLFFFSKNHGRLTKNLLRTYGKKILGET